MHVRTRPITIVSIFAVCTVTFMMGLITPASAQIGEGTGLAEALRPEFFNRDIVIFVEGLDLDDTQRVIVEAMFDDYNDGFEEAQVAMTRSFEEMQETLQDADKSSVVRLALQPLHDLISTKTDLRLQLLSGVKTVLTDEQLTIWDSFLRRMRREKTMSKGRLDGEKIDLFKVIRDIRLPDSILREIQPILDEYEVILDAALIAREESFLRNQTALLESISNDQEPVNTTEAELQVNLRVRIREINDHYRDMIAQTLPGELGGEFLQIALEKAYPEIYRKSLLQRSLEAALELEDLEPETIVSIQEIQGTYSRELADINVTLLAKHQANQPQDMRDRIASLKARISGQRSSSPPSARNRRDTEQRDAITDNYMRKLEALLTIEQFAAIPQAQRFLERQRRLERLRSLEAMQQDGSASSIDVISLDKGKNKSPDRNKN